MFCALCPSCCAESFNKIHIDYPLDIHYADGSGHLATFSSSRDKLTCFGNRDYAEPTMMETLGCMSFGLMSGMECTSLWGSRSLSIESNSSVEFYRSTQYQTLKDTGESVSMRVQRWLHVEGNGPELRQIPAEPFYLCARSNDWREDSDAAEFSVFFRSAYMRNADRYESIVKVLMHCILVIAMSSMWLLPYVVAAGAGTVAYSEGLRFDTVLTLLCFIILLCFPLMLQPKNLHMARHYLKYFFTRMQAEETRQLIHQKLPLFQATFFSSALLFVGTLTARLIYSYCGVDRETRNVLIRCTMALSASWFVFFLCRSFERFCHDWFWVVLSITLTNQLEAHLNPSSRNKVILASLLLNFAVALFPRVTGYRFIWRNGVVVEHGKVGAAAVGDEGELLSPFICDKTRGSRGILRPGPGPGLIGTNGGGNRDEILAVMSEAVDAVFGGGDGEDNDNNILSHKPDLSGRSARAEHMDKGLRTHVGELSIPVVEIGPAVVDGVTVSIFFATPDCHLASAVDDALRLMSPSHKPAVHEGDSPTVATFRSHGRASASEHAMTTSLRGRNTFTRNFCVLLTSPGTANDLADWVTGQADILSDMALSAIAALQISSAGEIPKSPHAWDASMASSAVTKGVGDAAPRWTSPLKNQRTALAATDDTPSKLAMNPIESHMPLLSPTPRCKPCDLIVSCISVGCRVEVEIGFAAPASAFESAPETLSSLAVNAVLGGIVEARPDVVIETLSPSSPVHSTQPEVILTGSFEESALANTLGCSVESFVKAYKLFSAHTSGRPIPTELAEWLCKAANALLLATRPGWNLALCTQDVCRARLHLDVMDASSATLLNYSLSLPYTHLGELTTNAPDAIDRTFVAVVAAAYLAYLAQMARSSPFIKLAQ